MNPDEFQNELLAAFRSAGADLATVQVEDADGLHITFVPPEDDDRYAGGGTLFIPRAVLDASGG